MISYTEKVGYEPALVGKQQLLVTDQRKSSRLIVDNLDFAHEIFTRIPDYLPKRWLGHELSSV